MQRSVASCLAAGGGRDAYYRAVNDSKRNMLWLWIASGFSLIGIGAVVLFATRVDPLSGRVGGRYRKR
ncbi:hypothetical protein GIY62_17075 [Burkholderia plantarii]|uniref:hypothetical protein n=1 Tax=Burkholderia plantarii TaxID=41899 RepID=UPI00272A378F|nr:hypothetical protein [Burkholderia plantarii]WLE61087.1 hypothetical protein GIY62_17075 [Burkholderia plantarii]